MIDSVFDSVLFNETPFPEDVPLIPLENIQAGLDRVEDEAIAGQMAEIEREGDRILFQGLRAVEAGDVQAINELDWGLSGALQRPIYQLWENGYRLGGADMLAEMRSVAPQNFARFISAEVAAALQQMLQLQPAILINTAAQTAVLNRVIAIAGNFSRDLLNQLKIDLTSAIVPQPTTGQPISRRQLLDRIQNTLSVSRSRASNIATTELTNAYNTGRVASAQQSELVEAFRFLAIDDSRTTEICRSRNGMIIAATDQAAIAANKPSLHYRCRSTLSPVLPRVSRRHRSWMNDPDRDYRNRNLVPLMPGWNGAAAAPTTPQTWQDFVVRGRQNHAAKLAAVDDAIAIRNSTPNPLQQQYSDVAFEVGLARANGEKISRDLAKRVKAIEKQFWAERDRINQPALDAIAEFRDGLKTSSSLTRAQARAKVKAVTISSGAASEQSERFWRSQLADLQQITNGRQSNVNLLIQQSDRAWASSDGRVINVGVSKNKKHAASTLWHEYGHTLEDADPVVQSAAQQWVRDRATGQPQPLNQLTGINAYGASEMAYPDQFISPYVGKVYPNATEVVSMGVERFADERSLLDLYERDPEHFYFILGLF